MEKIIKRGQLVIKCAMAEASAPIRYRILWWDDDEGFVCTPFQTADAKHSEQKALKLVRKYLDQASG